MNKIAKIMLPLLLVPMGLLVYSNAFSGPFLLDDIPYIVDNEWIRSLSNLSNVSGLRYVGDLSYAINYSLGGLDPFGYHLVNVAIHIANSLLLFSLITTVSKAFSARTPAVEVLGDSPAQAIAFCSSVIFLLHPIQIQAVTYISQRYTSLAAFFYFLALLLYLKAFLAGKGGGGARRSALYIGALVAALLAMKTKEISFTLPFVMALFDFTLFSGGGGGGGARRRSLRLAPFFFIAMVIPLGLFLPSIGVMKSGNKMEELMRVQKLSELSSISSYHYLLTQAGVITTYIRLVLFPVHRYFNYYFPLADSFFVPAVYIPAAALAAFFGSGVILVIRSVRRRSLYALLAGLGILWFFLTLSVESSVMPIRGTFAERRIYLPSAGLILALVTGIFYAGMALGKRWNVHIDAVKLTAVLLLVAALPLAALTHSSNELWNDGVLLCEEEVKKRPNSSSAHMYLGIEYFKRGRSDDALVEFKLAASISPGSIFVHRTLSKYYFRVGLIDEAIAESRLIIGLNPDDREARYNLGALYFKEGKRAEAAAEFKALLGRDADDAPALRALERVEGWNEEGP